MTEHTGASMLAAASREHRAAYALVVDPQVDNVSALPHLVAAWRATSALSRGEAPELGGEALEAWLKPEHLALVPQQRRKSVLATLQAALVADPAPAWETASSEAPTVPKEAALLRNLQALGRVLDEERAHQEGQSLVWRRRLRWLLRAGLWSGGAALFVAVALRPWQNMEIGNWRTAYYPSKDFKGDPDTGRDVDVDFDWGLEPPTDAVNSDWFSARWDTCLTIEEPTHAAFMIVSDDGARVFLDGKKIVDSWKKGRRKQVKGKRIKLKPGLHHLRVEYFEDTHKAEVHLTASFDKKEAPSQIPSNMLQFPGMEFEVDSNPCEALE